jgi:hypothetical protein
MASVAEGRVGLPNKGMKLTKPERIGALQLIPGVRRTNGDIGWPAWSTEAGTDAGVAQRTAGPVARHNDQQSRCGQRHGADRAGRRAVLLPGRAHEAGVALTRLRTDGGYGNGAGQSGRSSNKGMKLTSVERIERSQLIPGVRRTVREGERWTS